MSEESSQKGQLEDKPSLIDEFRRKNAKADEGREPEFLRGRLGTRMISRRALLERIVAEFIDEHGAHSQALAEADTEAKRLKLILATVDYVVGIESIQLESSDKAELIRRTYGELFTYGPLDALLEDDRITTILLEGADKVSVRYGHGELTSINPIFEDESHLRKVVRRLLLDAGTDFQDDQPLMEVGIEKNGKRVAVNLALPPITFQITVDIRVHRSALPKLDDLLDSGFINEPAKTLLLAIADSPHGFVIVGDTESGKTTFLSVMAKLLDESSKILAVERTGELHLSDNIKRYMVQWGLPNERQAVTFSEQIHNCLNDTPDTILIDEIRADETTTVLPLLSYENVPRQIWTFRGPSNTKRLISALGMLARRADPAQSEMLVRALYERLPFVITLKRTKQGIQLYSIGEWQFVDGSDYPDFVELITLDWDKLVLTGKRPLHDLDLDQAFWN